MGEVGGNSGREEMADKDHIPGDCCWGARYGQTIPSLGWVAHFWMWVDLS